jgi:hypothetical protein
VVWVVPSVQSSVSANAMLPLGNKESLTTLFF